jgi:hypothetical protein
MRHAAGFPLRGFAPVGSSRFRKNRTNQWVRATLGGHS